MTAEQNIAFNLRNARCRARDGGSCRRRAAARHRSPAGQEARPALGRRAAARGARPRPRPQAARLPHGRAALQPRREAARGDADRARALHQDLGITTVYVTHDQVEALTLSTRLAVMRDGRLQQVGAPEEVYASPANTFVARFIGAPSMNIFKMRATAPSSRAPRMHRSRCPWGPIGKTLRRRRDCRRRTRAPPAGRSAG